MYTIGHSSRSWSEFVQILRWYDLEHVIDVRAKPFSRRFPQVDRSRMRRELFANMIEYSWMGDRLGGLRESVENSSNLALPISIRCFADYMQTSEGGDAVNELVEKCSTGNIVLLSAEKNPTQCHRRIISDYLSIKGVTVTHIVDLGEKLSHRVTDCARDAGTSIIYDRFPTFELIEL